MHDRKMRRAKSEPSQRALYKFAVRKPLHKFDLIECTVRGNVLFVENDVIKCTYTASGRMFGRETGTHTVGWAVRCELLCQQQSSKQQHLKQ